MLFPLKLLLLINGMFEVPEFRAKQASLGIFPSKRKRELRNSYTTKSVNCSVLDEIIYKMHGKEI